MRSPAVAGQSWQGLAFDLTLLAIMTAVCRWLTGPTFGYTLFAITLGPAFATYVAAGRSLRISAGLVVIISALIAWPWWAASFLAVGSGGLPTSAAVKLSAMLLAFNIAVSGITHLLNGVVQFVIRQLNGMGRQQVAVQLADRLTGWMTVAIALSVIVWLTWVIMPVTMTDTLFAVLGDSMADEALLRNPLLVANFADSTSGDWTHQPVAYRWLTRLGQDIPFIWPESIGPCLKMHIALGGLAWTAAAVLRCSTWNKIDHPT